MTITGARLTANPKPDLASHLDPEDPMTRIGNILVEKGQCDSQTLDRGRRVAD